MEYRTVILILLMMVITITTTATSTTTCSVTVTSCVLGTVLMASYAFSYFMLISFHQSSEVDTAIILSLHSREQMLRVIK